MDYINLARRWRQQNPENADSGIVMIWKKSVYGWKNCLRDPQHERPGVIAVDADNHIFIAQGGNDYDGAICWVVYNEEKDIS